MVSLEGLKTWFEYEILITGGLLIAIAIFWAVEQLAAFVEIPPFTPQFALALAGVCVLALLFVLWDAGR